MTFRTAALQQQKECLLQLGAKNFRAQRENFFFSIRKFCDLKIRKSLIFPRFKDMLVWGRYIKHFGGHCPTPPLGDIKGLFKSVTFDVFQNK